MFKKIKSLLSSSKTENKEDGNGQEESGEIVEITFDDELAVKNIPKLRNHGVTDNEIYKAYVGHKGKERDIVWSLYNMLLTKVKNDDVISNIYEDMARMLHEEGKSYKQMLELSFKFRMKFYKNTGISKVRILSDREGNCEIGENLDGKELTIDEATENNPIPSKDCKQEFCNCTYMPV